MDGKKKKTLVAQIQHLTQTYFWAILHHQVCEKINEWALFKMRVEAKLRV